MPIKKVRDIPCSGSVSLPVHCVKVSVAGCFLDGLQNFHCRSHTGLEVSKSSVFFGLRVPSLETTMVVKSGMFGVQGGPSFLFINAVCLVCLVRFHSKLAYEEVCPKGRGHAVESFRMQKVVERTF